MKSVDVQLLHAQDVDGNEVENSVVEALIFTALVNNYIDHRCLFQIASSSPIQYRWAT